MFIDVHYENAPSDTVSVEGGFKDSEIKANREKQTGLVSSLALQTSFDVSCVKIPVFQNSTLLVINKVNG